MAEFVPENIYLSLTQLLNIKFWKRLLELNLLQRMHVSLWITLKEDFSKTNKLQPCIWFRYSDDIFFIWRASEKELEDFLNRLNSFHPNLSLLMNTLEKV